MQDDQLTSLDEFERNRHVLSLTVSKSSETSFELFKEINDMSRVVRKMAFCVCENKDADQLRGSREADQRLCFRYIDSTIPLLPKYEFLSL